jgi:sodium/pantothenate symporter
MSWLEAHSVQLAVLGVYLALMAWHAVEGRRESRHLVDYYAGGRSMGGIVIGLSFYSTYFSTNTFVGHAGRSYSAGFVWTILGVVVLSCALVSWHVFAWRMRRMTAQLDSLTVPDFLGFRYESRAVRVLSAGVIVVAALFYVVAIYKGIAHVLESYLGISYAWAVILIAVVVGLYTAAGGFISVVRTDAVQAVIMIFGAVLIFFAVVQAGGGWQGSLERIAALDEPLPDGRALGPALLSREGLLPLGILLGLSLSGGLKFLAEPRQITRFYGIRDARQLKIAMIVAPAAIGLSYLCLLPVGVLARAVVPPGTLMEDTDRLVPMLLGEMHLLGPLAGALILAAFVAAAMSSLDSVLLIVGGSLRRDLWEMLRASPSEQASLRGTRLAVLLYTAFGAAVALRPPGDIVEMTAFSGSLYAACFLPPLTGGLYWARATRAATLATFAAGFVTVVGWKLLLGRVEWLPTAHEVFPGILVGALTFLLVSGLSRRPDAALLRRIGFGRI